MDLKEQLLAKRVGVETAEVEIEGVGTITIRGLSRAEYLSVQDQSDPLKAERRTLSRAMVDPVMTEADIAAWQKASGPMEINAVAMKVNELSGIGQGADKSDVPEVRDEP